MSEVRTDQNMDQNGLARTTEVKQWGNVGDLKKVENKLCSCILDQLQKLSGAQRQRNKLQ